MSTTTLMIIILVTYAIYFSLTWVWMNFSLRNKQCLNYYIFSYALKKPKIDIMHYVERAMTILLFIGFITTIVSQIQIIYHSQKGESND